MAKHRRRAKSKTDYRRRAAYKAERDKILIVTEGEKTEPIYFTHLIQELGLTTAKVKIVGDGGSNPKSVVRDAISILEKDDDFEQIYLVIDRDGLEQRQSYCDALEQIEGMKKRKKLRSKKLMAITSVPCFEFWYQLHISDSRKPYDDAAGGASPAKKLIDELKKHNTFSDYNKSSCTSFYGSIAPQRNSAKVRAARFLDAASKDGQVRHHENPSTRVHLLVESLEEVANEMSK